MGPQDLLDALDEIVYVSDPNTYELLYANRRCRSLLPTRDYKGKPCYALLQGQPAPCPYCTNARLSSSCSVISTAISSRAGRPSQSISLSFKRKCRPMEGLLNSQT